MNNRNFYRAHFKEGKESFFIKIEPGGSGELEQWRRAKDLANCLAKAWRISGRNVLFERLEPRESMFTFNRQTGKITCLYCNHQFSYPAGDWVCPNCNELLE